MSEQAKTGWGQLILLVGVPCVLAGFFLGKLQPRAGSSPVSADYVLEELDYNHDGLADVRIFHKGHQSWITYDRNFDGRPDYWEWLSNRIPVRCEADNNFDGVVDFWGMYHNGCLASARADTDFNGIADNLQIYRNGLIDRVEWYPNGQTNVLAIEYFENGILRKIIRKGAGSQARPRSTTFDPFGQVLENGSAQE